DAGHMGTWDFDVETESVTFSPQLEAIHGYEPGSFGGTLDAYYAHLHPDDVDQVRQSIGKALTSGVLNVVYRAPCPDGREHWVAARRRVVGDEQGRLVGLRGVCLDVTAREQAGEERARLIQREQTALEAKAALEERQRLARDLHDSVSQALYGITLGSQAALEALAHDAQRDAAVDACQSVLRLAEARLP